ncbi:MAG: tyrosine--tRNA ligase [Alphaproteobacteria bacterium]|nr:tyrosine--tRNA ligase [Alphaproteobacteria bacterium]
MAEYRSTFLNTLAARGFIHQCTDEAGLDERASSGVINGYIGFDCTAKSLHVGSLVQIMMLRWLQKCGHRPIVLMGGGTTRIGDPSGRDESRRMLSDADIAANMAGIKSCFARFLSFGDGPTDAVMLNNADWLNGLAYIDFLRDYGAHFTVNRMLSFDSVKLRLERDQSLTFLEFNYMVLQAYDFLELARRRNCLLQMGGSDQWGNIVNGVELARRVDGRGLYGLTTPLITTASGAKMGKTAQGAIWIDDALLAPYDYYQYWRNTDDKDVGRFLRLFTDLALDEVRRLEALEGAELNEAKKVLAHAATTLCHGVRAADEAAETARRTFEEGGVGSDLPTLTVERTRLEAGVPLANLMREIGISASNGEARRLIAGGGARLNDQPVTDPQRVITTADFAAGDTIKLSAGKKRHGLLRKG